METKNVIASHNLSQEALAEKVFVSRQAVSRYFKCNTKWLNAPQNRLKI